LLSWGETAVVPAPDRANPARSREIYQHYAVVLYRQALLNLDDPASAGHVACDAFVNEYALAALPERGEDDARYRLAESVFRRLRQLAAASAVLLRAVLRKGAARSGTGDITVAGRDRGPAESRRTPDRAFRSR
jgi:hypothetical protein